MSSGILERRSRLIVLQPNPQILAVSLQPPDVQVGGLHPLVVGVDDLVYPPAGEEVLRLVNVELVVEGRQDLREHDSEGPRGYLVVQRLPVLLQVAPGEEEPVGVPRDADEERSDVLQRDCAPV